MEKIEKDFDKVNGYISKLSSSFSKDILKKKAEFDSLVKNIQKKDESSLIALTKLKSLESNISVLEGRVAILGDEIISKEKQKDTVSDKSAELSELEKKRDTVLLETRNLTRERDATALSVDNISKDLRELQNHVEKMTHERVSLMERNDEVNKQISVKDGILAFKERNILPLDNEIFKKESKAEEMEVSYRQKEKEFGVLLDSVRNLEKQAKDLDVNIKSGKEKLVEDLNKLDNIDKEFSLRRRKLKNEEDRLISIKKDILETILNNKAHIESRKIADLIKSVEDAAKA